MRINKLIAEQPWVLAVGVALLVILWMASGVIGSDPESRLKITETVGQAEGLTRVQIRSQSAEPVIRQIKIYGQTAPARSVEISAETEGRVDSLAAVRGKPLRKGDVILRLDLRDRQARLAQAEASVAEALTSYEAQIKLKSDGYVSDTQIAETVSRLESARAELIRAKLDLEYMVVRAPFDGVLQERAVEIGDFVRAGDPVASYVDNTSIIVTGTIAEQDARFVRVDNLGTAKLATGQNVSGRIRYVSVVADESTRTFNVELAVPNPDGSLPAGVTAEMILPGGETIAQKVSPSLLTLDADGNIGIKVVDEYNKVAFYPVDLAVSNQDGAWVTGLPESVKIITLGQGYVAVGQIVESSYSQTDTALADSESESTAEQLQ
jgi:multidrug efflux system membrane fusion protein